MFLFSKILIQTDKKTYAIATYPSFYPHTVYLGIMLSVWKLS